MKVSLLYNKQRHVSVYHVASLWWLEQEPSSRIMSLGLLQFTLPV